MEHCGDKGYNPKHKPSKITISKTISHALESIQVENKHISRSKRESKVFFSKHKTNLWFESVICIRSAHERLSPQQLKHKKYWLQGEGKKKGDSKIKNYLNIGKIQQSFNKRVKHGSFEFQLQVWLNKTPKTKNRITLWLLVWFKT